MIKYNIPNRNLNSPCRAPRPQGPEESQCALCQDTDGVPLHHKFRSIALLILVMEISEDMRSIAK